MNKTLKELRQEINLLDEELIKILAKRMGVVAQIGKLKNENNISLLDEKRWEEVLKHVLETAAKNNLSKNLIKEIYENIHKTALETEKV